jgi:hypothetical protein
MRIFKVYSIFLFLVFSPKIAICSMQMPNSLFKIDSENKLFSLISIPETMYKSEIGETIVINNKEKKQVWRINEYLDSKKKIYLSNDGDFLFIVNDLKWFNSFSENPTVLRILSKDGKEKTFTYFDLFGYYNTQNNEFSSTIAGFYLESYHVTLFSNKEEKVTVNMLDFTQSKKAKLKQFDLQKAKMNTFENRFSNIAFSSDPILANSATPFMDTVLFKLKTFFQIDSYTEKSNMKVALYLSYKVSNGSANVWNCDIVIKNDSGFFMQEQKSEEIRQFIESLTFENKNPFDANNWIYSKTVYLK